MKKTVEPIIGKYEIYSFGLEKYPNKYSILFIKKSFWKKYLKVYYLDKYI